MKAVGSYSSFQQYRAPLSEQDVYYEGLDRNPVIVIHGIFGAKLADKETGEVVWGEFQAGKVFPPEFLRKMAHPMGYGKPLNTLQSPLEVSGLMDKADISIFGVNMQMQAYGALLETLETLGYRLEPKPYPPGRYPTLFVFAYDWRRDIVENAQRLADFIAEKRTLLQVAYERDYGVENYDVQFDIVAHSMGGLIARYYLMYGDADLPTEKEPLNVTWRGAENVDKVILVGTPNDGYIDTCIELVNGLALSAGYPRLPGTLLGTFPSYYQMMPPLEKKAMFYKDAPTEGFVDYTSAETFLKHQWSLVAAENDPLLEILMPDTETQIEREILAFDHLKKCLKRAREFRRAMDVTVELPDGIECSIFFGAAVPTSASAAVDRGTGKVQVGEYRLGDGKVLAESVLADQRNEENWSYFADPHWDWRNVITVNAAHMGLVNNAAFVGNLGYILLSQKMKNEDGNK